MVKYFAKIPLVFSCAAALNPCLNFNGVEHLITRILQNLDLTYGIEDGQPNYVAHQIAEFNETFENLFSIYATKHGFNETNNQFGAGTSRQMPDTTISLYNTLIQDGLKRQRTSTPTSELGNYRSTNFLLSSIPMEQFNNFDILAWWKTKQEQYPILAHMARDLLAVQASTVASESAFSVSGRIVSERRSRLTYQAIEVCVCLKDYLDGVDRIQNEESLEGPLGEDVEDTIAREEEDAGLSPTSTENEVDEGEFEQFDVDDNLEDLRSELLDL